MTPKPQIIIVDEQDNVITARERSDLRPGDIYRVSALWITDPQGRILLARRAYSKKQHPGKWGPAVAGTVEVGETYVSNMVKETNEELGLDIKDPPLAFKERSHSQFAHFTQWFRWRTTGDETIKFDPVEVAETKWFTPDELRAQLVSNSAEFLDGMSSWLNRFQTL